MMFRGPAVVSALMTVAAVLAAVASHSRRGPQPRSIHGRTVSSPLKQTDHRSDRQTDNIRRATVGCIVALGLGRVVAPVAGVLSAGIVLAAPVVARRVRSWRETRSFEHVLPVLLDEMARGLRAGLSPVTALLEAGNVCGPPFPAALRPVTDRLGVGEDLGRALGGWASERKSRGVALFASAVAVGRTIGSLNGRAVDAVAATLREQLSLRSEIAVHVAQAQISAAVMTVAPLAFCALLVLGNASASSFLVGTPWGWGCITAGITLDAVGALWMLRIAKRAAQP